MPGPFWSRQLRELDANIESCRSQVRSLAEQGFTEVYKDADTIVEIAIKKGKSSRSSKNVASDKLPDKVIKSKVVERLSKPGSPHHAKLGAAKSKGPSSTVTSIKKEKESRHKDKERRRRRSRSGERTAETEPIKEKSSGKTQSELQDEIAELRQALIRATSVNSELVALLKEKSDQEEQLERAREEATVARRALEANKVLFNNMTANLAAKEQENARLKNAVAELQTTLTKGLKELPPSLRLLPPPPPPAVLFKEKIIHDSSTADSVTDASDSDSAVFSRSNPSSSRALHHTEGIISDAKNLLLAASASETNPGKTKSKAEPKNEAKVPVTPPTKLPRQGNKGTMTAFSTVSKDEEGRRLRAATDAGIKDFLQRMRDGGSDGGLNVTLPKMPEQRNFECTTVAEMSTDSSAFGNTLSESKFRRGLEASILLATDEE